MPFVAGTASLADPLVGYLLIMARLTFVSPSRLPGHVPGPSSVRADLSVPVIPLRLDSPNTIPFLFFYRVGRGHVAKSWWLGPEVVWRIS